MPEGRQNLQASKTKRATGTGRQTMRNNSYFNADLNSRPDIFSVIGRYVFLKRRGRESTGLCPLHADKNPSLAVNEDKQVWYCHACSIGGDAIRFVELVEGVPFKEAVSILGMGQRPQPPQHSPARRAAKWVNDQIQKMNIRLRDLDEQIELADEIPDPELAESLWNERRVLADMRDDLGRSEYRADFVEIKDVIEGITKGFE